MAGCTSTQLNQSLLIHENQRLEDALYVAHARLADLQRENDSLRNQQNESFGSSGRSSDGLWDEGFDFSPLEMPTVILPGDNHGTTEVPESLKGSHMFHVWMPAR